MAGIEVARGDNVSQDRSGAKVQSSDLLSGVVDAAYMVAHFAKHHDYPEIGTTEFGEFARHLNRLEIELKKVGYPVTR